MAQTIIRIQTKLMKEYYQYFSKYAKGKQQECKVAWITAFAPVEILETLGIACYYPESYAAVIAASGMEQPLLSKSEESDLSRDCCSYSCCMQGCLELEEGPRGVPPKPDLLIATNNQCNTLPNWWNILAHRYKVPLIVIDYPGDGADRDAAYNYVTAQHRDLIMELEKLTGNKLSMDRLAELVANSRNSVNAWKSVISHIKEKEIVPTGLFDDISFLITARCRPETAEMYTMLEEEYSSKPMADRTLIPLFWLGYPLWYHSDRYLSTILEGCRIAGSNYITWWNIDSAGQNLFECLFNAYNYTFLNLSQKTRNERLGELICDSGAKAAVTLRNKSCKCDFVSAKNIYIPQVEIDMDMIDRTILDEKAAMTRIDLIKETICSGWE